MNFVLHFLVLCIKFTCIILVMQIVFGSRTRWKQRGWIFRIVICMCVLLIETWMEYVAMTNNVEDISPILHLLSAWLVLNLKPLDCTRKTILAYLLVEAFGTVIALASSNCFAIRIDSFYENPLIDMINIATECVLLALISYLLRKNRKTVTITIPTFIFALLVELLVVLQIAFVTYVLGNGVRNNVRVENTYVIIVMLGSSFCMALYFLYIHKSEQIRDLQKQQIAIYRREQELTKNYYTRLYEKNEQTRARQHDMHHMLQTVEAMMKEGEYEKTLAFIQKWKKSEGTKNKIIYSQNRIVDAVIDGVLGAELERNEITLNYSGKIPQQIGIDDLDLCLLISNLLENAKEAVQKLDTGERQIGLKIGRKESLICINIRNPYTQGGECVKEEGWHGYGLKNVKEIVEKYDGEIQVQDINNIFTVSIILESTQNE